MSIQQGIYLEVKKTVIGVGHTAKTEQYRNFWMTVGEKSGMVTLILLDEDFQMTGVSEQRPLADFESGTLKYIPQGDKKYQGLLKKLAARKAGRAAPKAEAQAAPQKAAGWWEQPGKDVSPGDIFKKEEQPRKQPSGGGGGNWWEGGSGREITSEDLFSTGRSDKKQAPRAASGKKKETSLKKTWWDK